MTAYTVSSIAGNTNVFIIEIGSNYRGLVITGPNAGGKTVALKTVGILTLMTQCGFDICASEDTQISVFEKIFVDIGDKRNTFIKEIRQVEDEETIVKKLQNKYRNGEIKEEDMTEEQINSLCALYDKQIANLKKSNDLRKQKLLEYRRKLQTE